MKKILLLVLVLLVLPISVSANSESPFLSDWFMHGRDFERSSWDGVFFNSSVEDIVFGDVSLPDGAQQVVVSDGFLYVVDAEGVSRYNASNISMKIDSFTGVGGAWGPENGLVVTDYLYFVGGSGYNTLYQVDKFNLSNVISSVSVNPDAGTITRRPCVPVVAEGYVFCNSGTSGAGVPQDMVYFSRFNASFVEDASSIERTQFVSGETIFATGFLAYSDGFIYGGVWDNDFVDEVYKVDIEDMSVVDSFVVRTGIHSGLVVKDGYLYVPGADSTLYKRDVNNLASGISVELSTDSDRTISTPAFYDGYVFVSVYPRQLRPDVGALYKLDEDLEVVDVFSPSSSGGSGFRAPTIRNGFIYVTHSDGVTYKLTTTDFTIVEELSSLSGAFNWPGVAATDDYYYGWYDSSNLFQAPICNELWLPEYGTCYANETQLLFYEDYNLCGTSFFIPEDNNTWVSCIPPSGSGGGGGGWPEDEEEEIVIPPVAPPEPRFDLIVFFEKLFSGELFRELVDDFENVWPYLLLIVVVLGLIIYAATRKNKSKKSRRRRRR